jgi:isopentenyl phosphate kinase
MSRQNGLEIELWKYLQPVKINWNGKVVDITGGIIECITDVIMSNSTSTPIFQNEIDEAIEEFIADSVGYKNLAKGDK